MKISSRFNRFFHGVVLKQIWAGNLELRITIERTNSIAVVRRFRPRDVWSWENEHLATGFARMKEELKKLNPDYPFARYSANPYSTREISNNQLLQHIEWTVMICVDTPEWVQREWEDMKLKAGIRITK